MERDRREPESAQQDANELLRAPESSRTRFTNGPIPPVTPETLLERFNERHSASQRAFDNAHNEVCSDQDLDFERLAGTFAYQDALTREDHAWLKSQGYAAGKIVHGQQGFSMMSFTPVAGSGRPPVLAFRGTNDLEDLADDLNAKGVGTYQFAANEGKIAAALGMLQAYGRAVVTGHSLGGALAQLAACRYPSLVARVVTFQAPGISKSAVERLESHNARSMAMGDGKEVKSHHYSVEGDVVSQAGEAHTPGLRTHMDFDVDSADRGFTLKHSVSHEDRKKGKQIPAPPTSDSIDRLRVGAGRLFAKHGLLKQSSANPELYVEVWESVQAALDRRVPFEQVQAIIQAAAIPEQEKALMLSNVREIQSAQATDSARIGSNT